MATSLTLPPTSLHMMFSQCWFKLQRKWRVVSEFRSDDAKSSIAPWLPEFTPSEATIRQYIRVVNQEMGTVNCGTLSTKVRGVVSYRSQAL